MVPAETNLKPSVLDRRIQQALQDHNHHQCYTQPKSDKNGHGPCISDGDNDDPKHSDKNQIIQDLGTVFDFDKELVEYCKIWHYKDIKKYDVYKTKISAETLKRHKFTRGACHGQTHEHYDDPL
uniref:Uncharacterized protein n=1 Tax=Romanomermis culicivorax TaxID=13658 RepID=A0A915L4B6_ROMCU